MIKHATIKDLAQALGISKSTVSRALADHSDVKPETKRLVLEMAEKMNYRPNPYAQNLIRRRSKVIGVVVPEFVNSFFPRIIIQIQKVFEKEGFNVLITQSGESAEIELKNLHLLENSMVEGIILSVTEKGRNDEYYRRLIDNGIPIVFFNRPSNEVEASEVVIDDFRMAFFAVEHVLYANGTKRNRPLHLMGPKGIFNSATRHQGYKQALSKHGIDPAPDTFVQCRDISRECGFETMNAILDGDRIPDAVFCFNDQLAIGALKAIKKRGYRIPEQIAVMGFSESQSALLTEPQLSSVAQPLDLIGETAANLLLAYLGMVAWKILYYWAPTTMITIFAARFLQYLVMMDVGLAVFNLIPIPPLDGSRILLVVLPQRIYFQIMRYERVIFVILLAAVWAGVLDGVLGTFNDVVWDLLDLGTGYIDQIAYSAYYATIGTVI